jgi:hypothetical protein
MATIINASVSPGGLEQSADSTGILKLQTGGVDAITIDQNQTITFNGSIGANSTLATTGKAIAMAIVFG